MRLFWRSGALSRTLARKCQRLSCQQHPRPPLCSRVRSTSRRCRVNSGELRYLEIVQPPTPPSTTSRPCPDDSLGNQNEPKSYPRTPSDSTMCCGRCLSESIAL